MNVDLIFKYGVITSIDDPDKVGRMQVRILPYMENTKENLLPWYYPFFAHGVNTPKYEPISVGTSVKVLCTDSFKNGWIISEEYLTGLFDFDGPSGTLGAISELSDTSYENLRFRVYENGNISFYNVSSGEHGLYHNSGSYTIFDNSGNIIANSKGNKVKIYNDLSDLKSILVGVRQVLENVITPGNLVASGSPVVYSQVGTDLPNLIQYGLDIDNLLLD